MGEPSSLPFPQTGEHPDVKEQGLELAVFLFLILPVMLISLVVIEPGSVGFVATAVSIIFRDVALVALIFFFLWRNREAIVSLGWRMKWRDVGLGVLLFIPFFFLTDWLSGMLESAGLSGPTASSRSFLEPTGSGQFLLALLMIIVVAITEETIFRGYLILRFEAVSRSPAVAVIASAVVFSVGHGYEGVAGMVTVGVMGIFLALVYIWRRNLAAPMTMHFLQDFLVIVLLPYVGVR